MSRATRSRRATAARCGPRRSPSPRPAPAGWWPTSSPTPPPTVSRPLPSGWSASESAQAGEAAVAEQVDELLVVVAGLVAVPVGEVDQVRHEAGVVLVDLRDDRLLGGEVDQVVARLVV